VRRESLNALLIALGILAAAFGLKGFLLSSILAFNIVLFLAAMTILGVEPALPSTRGTAG
jgi:hypothetical protein